MRKSHQLSQTILGLAERVVPDESKFLLRIFLSSVLAISFLLYPLGASAAAIDTVLGPLLGTQWVQSTPFFNDGKLSSCEITFAVVAQDFMYKQGGYIIVNGGVGFRRASDKVGLTLKVVVEDIDPQTGNTTPAPPASAYLIHGFETNKEAVIGTYPSDAPGGVFVIFNFVKASLKFFKAITENNLMVAFARRPGGADVQFKVDLRVVNTSDSGARTFSEIPMVQFGDCTSKLIKDVADELK